jgi:SAM-dependent methyltransferase
MNMKKAPWFRTWFEGMYAKVLSKQFDEAATLRQVVLVKRLLRLRRGQRVLDVPCGTGRLTIPLGRQGLIMTGVDLAPSYIRRARRLARKEGLDIRFHHADMRRIDFDAEFDAAFNWFTSIGYFDRAGDLEFCRRVLRALRPGGRFLVETMNKTALLSHFEPSGEKTVGNIHIATRTRWDGRSSRVHSTWTMKDGRRTERRTHSIRLYSGPELRSLLREAGFGEVRLYGNRPLGRLTRHARRLIAVAVRPER